MLIRELPEDIRKVAINWQLHLKGNIKDDVELTDSDLCFPWVGTHEGGLIWQSVSDGDFKPFYDFHKISPVAEWVPKEGDRVEVRNGDNNQWVLREFIYTTKAGEYICRTENVIGFVHYDRIRQRVIPRLTRTEIAEKFGVSKDFEFVDE